MKNRRLFYSFSPSAMMTSYWSLPLNATTEETDVVASVAVKPHDDSHVYVHCHCKQSGDGLLIRIWKTTYLIDTSSHSKSSLVHAENISMAPYWTAIPPSRPYSFLLIFTRLPGDCKVFDFVEEIAQPGGFNVRNIRRNETDVYHIDLL